MDGQRIEETAGPEQELILAGRRQTELNDRIIKSLAYIIDAKDRYTSGHSWRVANYARELARRLGKSKAEQKLIYHAGLLHDIGKIRIAGAVINKNSGLTDEEYDFMKVHTISGYHILKDIYEDQSIPIAAKYHHERYDGSGYPLGLMGEDIPEIARIIGVADAYDAMASKRSYREVLPQEVVRGEFEKGRGRQFDPIVADVMLQMIDEDKEYELRQFTEERKCVLYIDDEQMMHVACSFILKDSPFRLVCAESCREAMSILERDRVDLILLDMVMPETDGCEAFRMIKERYDIPVVFVSADKSIDTIQSVTELGADDYITKPLQPMVLLETVHGILNKWRR